MSATLSRRDLLAGAAGLAAFAAAPRIARAAVTIGGTTVETLSDGNLSFPASFLLGDPPNPEMVKLMFPDGSLPGQLKPDCNVTLVRDGENTILFDVGSGPDFMSSAGKLPDTLDAAGIAVEDVTHVVFTHGHPDHLWGLLDDFDEPTFPEAQYMIGKREWDHWMDPATAETGSENRRRFAAGAQRRLSALEDAILFFNDGEEIIPGVAARASHGHTPGHMSFEVRAGSESVMVVGDAISNAVVSFARPDLPWGSDEDKDMGATARASLLDQIASAQMAMVGFHLPGGGMGRAERKDGAYRFTPIDG